MKSLLSFVLCLGLLFSIQTQASDPVRPIPADALKAQMLVTGERTLSLNDLTFRLAPGGRILNQKNLITLTQSLRDGNTRVVRVKFNQQGEVQTVWILTTAEDAVSAPALKSAESSWWWPF